MSENYTKDGIEVKVGQVWRDLDERVGNRYGKVIAVLAGKAKLEMCRADGSTYHGSTTRISIRRMHKHSTGWALVSDSLGQEGGAKC